MCKSLSNSFSLPSIFALFCTGPDAQRLAVSISRSRADPLKDGFQASSLDQDEVEHILDACIKHSDHWSGFKVSAMVLLRTAMGFRGKLKLQQ